ncbi:glycosyltransferase family 9 protein [Desulfobulbus oligotrophicus]|uniref:Glycosyltransferase family 9 protein n=1 Tax=Desulfobulbus oligotrophicus TaxID=1909699 RepID=A0A7T6AQ93_9BACT|nr:glycosyltransferase family 9 protein [Desulfobulbus oligotrophicus]QQG65313.1 glycosyltransferase family 9 protein [Desulfobulbus oligotrophicus]
MELDGKRILIIKQSSLGDIIHTLPLVHAVRRQYPLVCIGWIVEQGFAALLERDDAVDVVHPIHIPSTSDPGAGNTAYWRAFAATVSTLQRLRQQFKASPYDLILDLHASFRSGLLGLVNPGGLRIGFKDAKEGNTWFQHRLVNNAAGYQHAVDKNLLFCEQLGCAVAAEDFYLCTDPDDQAKVASFLKEEGILPHDRIVYVNATARWQSKFWFVSRWSELCDRLLAAGVRPVLGGSRADLAYLTEIVESMSGKKAVIAAGRLSLPESIALMKRADVYVGLDTGPMHVAAMVGTPVVALFGPTHPERVGPYGVRHVVMRAEHLDCLCCRKRSCDHQRCMEEITTDSVFAQVMNFIESEGLTRPA